MTARTHHCRGCTRAARQPTRTRQLFTHPNVRDVERAAWLLRATEAGLAYGLNLVWVAAAGMVRKPAEHWRCTQCASTLVTMSDVPDTIGLCMHTARRIEKNCGRDFGADWREEAEQELAGALAAMYRRWKPWKQRSFLAYASTTLRNRLIDWERANKGRDTPKPLIDALSLDEPLGSDDERTRGDGVADPRDALADVDSVINARALTPRSRMFHERIALPALERDLTLEQSADRLGWTRAQLLRLRSAYYEEIRAQVAA